MRFGIVVFPGSNCDEDAFHAAKTVFGQDAEYLWHYRANHPVYAIAVPFCIGNALQHQRHKSLADRDPIGGLVERATSPSR